MSSHRRFTGEIHAEGDTLEGLEAALAAACARVSEGEFAEARSLDDGSYSFEIRDTEESDHDEA